MSPLNLLLIPLLLSLSTLTLSFPLPPNHILLPSSRKLGGDDTLYCTSWQLSVETNNAGPWQAIPARCQEYVSTYMEGPNYPSDLAVASEDALVFAKSVDVSSDGKDAWVFDVDETLLSNLPYYEDHSFGLETFNETSFDEWALLGQAPALPASLNLYKELQQLGFTVFILTGRSEPSRNSTSDNLRLAGFNNWERLILRQSSDNGKPATVYKSERRKELIDGGYRIWGSSGDQWTDLLGFAVAVRSFKLPNPMYYVP